jgi:hypothetical protein
MTRKFVYDPRVERVRKVAGPTGTNEAVRRSRPLRWLLLVVVLGASALAFDAAHTAAQAREHGIAAR